LNEELLEFLKEKFDSSNLNRLPENFGGKKIFSDPLIGVARGNDSIFFKFKEIVGSEHFTPLEMWLANDQKQLPASNLYTVSIAYPFTDEIRKESITPTILPKIILPAEIYSVARNFAKSFRNYIMEQTIDFFHEKGYNAVSGKLSEAYTLVAKKDFYSTWSENHVAFAAGLGTFGLHEGLITELGCNIRLASVITDAPLEITPRKSDEPYANCLYYAKGTCRECARKCPANAITEKGYDKTKCNKYRNKVAREMVPRLKTTLKSYSRRINWKYKAHNFPVGCELCQFGVECMDKNPMIHHYLDFD
jgi:epoxyqueuosine reductase